MAVAAFLRSISQDPGMMQTKGPFRSPTRTMVLNTWSGSKVELPRRGGSQAVLMEKLLVILGAVHILEDAVAA